MSKKELEQYLETDLSVIEISFNEGFNVVWGGTNE